MINFLIRKWSSYWSISWPLFVNYRAIASLWRAGLWVLRPKGLKAPSRMTQTSHRSHVRRHCKMINFMLVFARFFFKKWASFRTGSELGFPSSKLWAIRDWRSRREEEVNVGVRPILNMRAGLTFVREKVVWRTIWGEMAQNCRTRAKSEKRLLGFKVTFSKKCSKAT